MASLLSMTHMSLNANTKFYNNRARMDNNIKLNILDVAVRSHSISRIIFEFIEPKKGFPRMESECMHSGQVIPRKNHSQTKENYCSAIKWFSTYLSIYTTIHLYRNDVDAKYQYLDVLSLFTKCLPSVRSFTQTVTIECQTSLSFRNHKSTAPHLQ